MQPNCFKCLGVPLQAVQGRSLKWLRKTSSSLTTPAPTNGFRAAGCMVPPHPGRFLCWPVGTQEAAWGAELGCAGVKAGPRGKFCCNEGLDELTNLSWHFSLSWNQSEKCLNASEKHLWYSLLARKHLFSGRNTGYKWTPMFCFT